MKKNDKFYFFALAPTGEGISGSDRIFIELARQWSKKVAVEIFTTGEGVFMIKRQNLKGKYLDVTQIEKRKIPRYFLLKYLYKIYLGIRLGFSLNINQKPLTINHYLYSSSDFWMDVFPCVLLKIRYPKSRWVASWYQTAPNPLSGYAESRTKNIKKRTESYKLSAFLYWFSQLPIKTLIKKYADKVIVNNDDERKRFPTLTEQGDTIVLIGAVRLDEIKRFLNRQPTTDNRPLKFDAVFQGRFHPQKGVVELIDIWKKVVKKRPRSKLAMIGDGPLMSEVVSRIAYHGLRNNIKLFGYVFDGEKKYSIFQKSKLVVHPAFYDSGGMASAEAMAFGIPAVGFNLKAYKSYYPKGMVKVSAGDLKRFAKEIIYLLENEKVRNIIGSEAKKAILENWSWNKRATEILAKITT